MFGTTGKHSGAEVLLGFTRRGGWGVSCEICGVGSDDPRSQSMRLSGEGNLQNRAITVTGPVVTGVYLRGCMSKLLFGPRT